MGVEPFHVAANGGAGIRLPVDGSGLIKASTAQTGNAMTVLELTIGAKQGPGLHIHTRDDELWYVLEGEFRFKAAGRLFAGASGELVFGPRGKPHTFQNVADEPGRLLIITTRPYPHFGIDALHSKRLVALARSTRHSNVRPLARAQGREGWAYVGDSVGFGPRRLRSSYW